MSRHAAPATGKRRGKHWAVVGGLTGAAVWVTVGPWPALALIAVLVTDRLLLPDRRVLSTCALVAFVMIPIVWFAGSSLPLSPPAPRIQDNVVAHQVGGLAVWLLFMAVMVETRRGATRCEHVARTSDDVGENAA